MMRGLAPGARRGLLKAMHLPRLLAALMLLTGLLCTGCHNNVEYNTMSVRLLGFQPGADATHAVARLQFINEGLTAAGFSRSMHKLYLNGQYVGDIDNAEPFAMTPLKEFSRDLPLTLKNPAALRLSGGEASYRLNSTLFIQTGDERESVKRTMEGQVSLTPLPAR